MIKGYAAFLTSALLMQLILGTGTVSAASSVAPSPNQIKVTNNLVGTNDTISITGLAANDLVKIYADASVLTPLASGTVAVGSTTITIPVGQLGTGSGHVYVTVTSASNSESRRIVKSYIAEPETIAPSAGAIVIINNPAGTADTVTVKGLSTGDIIKVYDTPTGITPIGTADVTGASTSATVTIPQLGTKAGVVYITRTVSGKGESPRIEKSYAEEPQTQSPLLANISVINNLEGSADSIMVAGLKEGDVVKIYADSVTTTVLGTATVSSGSSNTTVSINEIGQLASKIYVTVTSSPKQESIRVSKIFNDQPKSVELSPFSIQMQQNSSTGTIDTILVPNLASGDIVKVYADDLTTSVLGTGTVAGGSTLATVSIDPLAANTSFVFVSVTRTGTTESNRTKKLVNELSITGSPSPGDIIIINNGSGVSDTITVKNLKPNDIVKVYEDETSTTLLGGSATVASNETSATVTIPQIGSGDGKVYVTVTSAPKAESRRTIKSFIGEIKSSAPPSLNIHVQNNLAGTDDIVTVKGLQPNDIVNVYGDENALIPIGTGTVSSTGSTIVIPISQLGAKEGLVYVSVTNAGKAESRRVTKYYGPEGVSSAPDRTAITVVNNAGESDTVTVRNVNPNDLIQVYADESTNTVLGSTTVEYGSTSGKVIIPQIGQESGVLYVSITSPPMIESTRTPKVYSSEPRTLAVPAMNIKITNAVGTDDTIVVTGLKPGDFIKAYEDESSPSELTSGTVDSSQSSVTLHIAQLGTTEGYLYVSITSAGKLESYRTKKSYLAE